MKDLSFFFIKNSLAAKMRKGFKSFCNGDGSTSILNQQKGDNSGMVPESLIMDSPYLVDKGSQPTLEEMILHLELEEKMARRAKLDDYGEIQHRMSCVNSSDILRSARNALNQYPRFSLDGKDAMYRSSFRNFGPVSTGGRKSICCNRGLRKGYCNDHGIDSEIEKTRRRLPAKLAGESVVWCKPGVVAKLMGLEAIPSVVNSNCRMERFGGSVVKKQNLRKRAERHHGMERRRIVDDSSGCSGTKRGSLGSCSKTGYCIMKPVSLEVANDHEASWQMRRF